MNPESCIDCMKCERNCPKNAIHADNGIPLFCMHCNPDKAPCLNICPEGAIEELGGAIVVNEEDCIGCGMCRDVCPIGAIEIVRGTANKCDLCINEESQQCIDSCPTEALVDDHSKLVSNKQSKFIKELLKLKASNED
ncbi:4Fe-4S dicluster domain-containing protein [Methanobrevibacter curvatus]